jgi:hypothetical protein
VGSGRSRTGLEGKDNSTEQPCQQAFHPRMTGFASHGSGTLRGTQRRLSEVLNHKGFYDLRAEVLCTFVQHVTRNIAFYLQYAAIWYKPQNNSMPPGPTRSRR